MTTAPTEIDLEVFCCSGGMAKGFADAGIRFHLAFDKNPDAVESYEANLGHCPVEMDVRDLLRLVRAGWRPAAGVRLLVADPPCTPWSRAGKRQGTEDVRDMLRETCELIALLQPRAYLIGNVPGLDDATNDRVVQKVIGGLGKHGYCTADYARLDAADYGVPQHRKRPFWFGHLEGPCVRWPSPTHCDPRELATGSLPGHEALLPWRTCRQALQHLPIAELGRPVRVRNKPSMFPCSKTDAPAGTIPAATAGNGGRVLLANENLPPNDPDAPMRTITITKELGRSGQAKIAVPPRWSVPQSEMVYEADEPAPSIQARTDRQKNGAATLSWPWDRQATTICAAIDKIAPANEHAGQFGPNAIVLSERAAGILQGFPENWRFIGKTKTSRWGMLGQAMPPALAYAVATSVLTQLEATK